MVHNKGYTHAVKLGAMGIIYLNNPKVPNFNMTPASNTEPLVLAATCASGNHKCTGINGIFTAKTASIPQPSIICRESVVFISSLNININRFVLPPSLYRMNMTGNNINEPNMVYKTILYAALNEPYGVRAMDKNNRMRDDSNNI
jgi:hypothetical protein